MKKQSNPETVEGIAKRGPRLATAYNWKSYPVRTCRTITHRCVLCGGTIWWDERYADGGREKRAHINCLSRQGVDLRQGAKRRKKRTDGCRRGVRKRNHDGTPELPRVAQKRPTPSGDRCSARRSATLPGSCRRMVLFAVGINQQGRELNKKQPPTPKEGKGNV